ncbi:MAG: ABC transporter transmembrane domain-containing protein [Chloroflexota bacterium]
MISLKKLAYFMYPYRWVAIGGIVTGMLPVLMELAVPRILQYMIDEGIRAESMSVVWRGGAILFGISFIGASMAFAQGWCRATLSQWIAFDLRNALFSHIQSLSFANLDQMPTGRLMTRISSDVDTLRMFSSANLALILRLSLMVFGSLVMMIWTNWQLSLIVIVLLVIASIILRILIPTAQPLFSRRTILYLKRLHSRPSQVKPSLWSVQLAPERQRSSAC